LISHEYCKALDLTIEILGKPKIGTSACSLIAESKIDD